MTKEEIKSRMKHLARKFCRRNNVEKEFDGSVRKLIEKSYLSAYLLCLHESKNKIAELEAQIEKMKCCGNCVHFDFNEPNYCHKEVYRERQYVCGKWCFGN